jgi:hypothetical protein
VLLILNTNEIVVNMAISIANLAISEPMSVQSSLRNGKLCPSVQISYEIFLILELIQNPSDQSFFATPAFRFANKQRAREALNMLYLAT